MTEKLNIMENQRQELGLTTVTSFNKDAWWRNRKIFSQGINKRHNIALKTNYSAITKDIDVNDKDFTPKNFSELLYFTTNSKRILVDKIHVFNFKVGIDVAKKILRSYLCDNAMFFPDLEDRLKNATSVEFELNGMVIRLTE